MATALRYLLRWLWEVHGTPKLDKHIRHYLGVRPRNVTATRAEIDALLAAANPGMRVWLLLCSDLAIRSGTAARMAPEHYDPERRTLRFTTKHHAKVTLPVTEEIRELIGQCDLSDPRPFARQLWDETRNRRFKPITEKFDEGNTLREHFQLLCKDVGITRRIIPHDLRRTTAVGMLEATGDLRDVQALLGHRHLTATLWYLDHDTRPVMRAKLELIKRPRAEKEEQTA